MSRQLTSKLDCWVRLIVITGMVLGAFGQPTTSYAQPVLSGLAQAETATPTSTPPTETETPTPEQITATPTTDVLQITEVPTDVVGTSTAEPTITVTVTATPQPTGTITTTATPEPSPTPIRTIPPDIIELLPPGLPIIEIKDSAEDGSQTVQIGRTGAALFFANNRIVVVAKPGTFNEDVQVIVRPQVIVKPPTEVIPPWATAVGSPSTLEATTTPATEKSATLDGTVEATKTADVQSEGLYSFEVSVPTDGAIISETPRDDGSVPADDGSGIVLPIIVTPPPPVEYEQPEEDKYHIVEAAEIRSEIFVNLEAQRVSDGTVIDTFAVDAQLFFDLRDLPGVYTNTNWYIRYQDENDPTRWIRVKTQIHDETGLFSTQTNHFSVWSTGNDPGAWLYRWQPPTVSEFSGAATYQYPVELPPGRGGLTPDLTVSYSSRGVDGLLKSNHEQVPLGLGWGLGTIEIARESGGPYCCYRNEADGYDYQPHVYKNAFELVMNGAGYLLVETNGYTTTAPAQYHVQGAPDLQVFRYVQYNINGEENNWYWVVKDRKGTVYRLGYTSESDVEQGMCCVPLWGDDIHNETTSIRWKVDTITDVHGNQIQYEYEKWSRSDNYAFTHFHDCPGPTCSWHTGNQNLTTWMTRPTLIRYNFTQVAATSGQPYMFERVSNTLSKSYVTFTDSNSDHYIDGIDVSHLDALYKKIAFTLSQKDYDAGQNPTCTEDTFTWVVDKITEKSPGGATLLETNFTYTAGAHYGSNQWCYAYLYEVTNGLGGKVRFNYTHDSRYGQNDIGYSWFVFRKDTFDGAHDPQYASTEYSYSGACYDRFWGLTSANTGGSFDCTQRDTQVPGTFIRTVGGLTGFNRVRVTEKDYDGKVLGSTLNLFYQGGDLFGKPFRQYVLDPNASAVIISNPGFEEGISGWTTYPASPSGFTQTITTTANHYNSGRNALQITLSGDLAQDHHVDSTALTGWAAGGTYWFNAYVKGFLDNDICFSIAGSKTGGNYEVSAGCAAIQESWTLFEGVVNLPSDATSATIIIRTNKTWQYHNIPNYTGIIHVDDIVIGKLLQSTETSFATYGYGTTYFQRPHVTLQTTYLGTQKQQTRSSVGLDGRGDVMHQFEYGGELAISNPDFEEGLAGWSRYCSGTNCTQPATIEAIQPPGNFAGSNRLKLFGAFAGGVFRDFSGFTSGEQVTVRVRIRAASANGNPTDFQLLVHDSKQTTNCPTYSSACITNTTLLNVTAQPITSTWQEVSGTFTVNTTGRFRLQLWYPNASASAFYVDEVSIARVADVGDERTTITWHNENVSGSNWLIGLPFATLIYKGINGHWCNNDLLTQSTQYYDGQNTIGFGQAAGTITKGLLTMSAKGMVYSCGTANYTTEQYAYDTWGNPKQVTDAGGHSVYTQYDSTLNLYPTSITTTVNSNVLSQTLQYYGVAGVGDQATNYPRGTLKQRQDANGQITTYTYDEFGRVKTIVRPGDSATYPSVTYTYTTSSYPFALQTDVRETSGCSTCVHSTYEYYDGLGQLLQTRAEMATAGQFTVNKVTYDSLGRAVRTTVPEQASGSTYVAATGSEQASRPVFDSWGRTVAAIAPDGTVSSVGYTDQTVVNADANGHYRINTLDTFGRTIRVDETITTTQTFAESFTSLNTSNWTYSCQGASAGCQSIDNGTLKNIGTGSNWNATVYRAGGDTISSTGSVAGIRVEFKVDSNPWAVFALQSGSDVYRRFGINIDGTRLYVQYNNTGSWTYPTDLINPITLNTWYVLELRVLPDGQGLIVVSERDNPAKSSAFVAPMPAGGSYHFQQWLYRGNAWMDNYSEFQPTYQPTKYTYNALDQLTVVTDTLNNTTVISYNVLGQKYEMLDPDMGFWKYGYDVRGNLSWQKDARQQQLCFTYDELNRLTAKHQLLSGSDCATDPKALLASFGYDNAANLGKGQRTSMSDATGTAEWRYDNRGRVISETRTITATALNTSYTTLMNYDALDRVITTTYPTGEVVTNTYNAQGLLATVRGLNDGLYVNGLTYDVASRLTNITLNNGLVTTYTYASWNDRGGRLLRIQTGASLLDFNYAYDAVGNIRTITDSVNSNQVLTFGYDALDRLTSASTSLVGNGQYTQTWGYNAIGNITATTLITTSTQTSTYTYTATAGGTCSTTQTVKPHATSGMGTNSYTYDCNGNMLTRGENGVTYQQQFNAENQLTVVTNTATGLATTFYYDGDGKRVLLARSDGSKVAYPSGLMEVEYTVSGPPPATGTYTVTKTADTNDGTCNADCSLREAIAAANANSNADVIIVPYGTYTLTRTGSDDTNSNGDLDITNPVTIVGAGANVTIIKGNTGWTDRILQLHSGKTATITGVTITGGNIDTGGGVRNSAGNLTISYSTISGNAAPTATGGGIYSDGPITLTHVSVLSNTAGTFAGGIRLAGGAAVFTNTTFSGNSAKENAGGVYIAAGSLTMDNVTITNNTADSDGVSPSGDGGGIRATGATVTIENTVIAGNVDSTSTQRPDCYGTLTSSGYNHIGNMTGCTMTPTSGDNTSGVSAQLAALANNGGTTLTHLPQSSSPVIDLGNGCITADQRGYGRNGQCDKGAAEFGGIAPASILTKTYYFAGSQLVAMREITTTGLAGTLYYLHQDHLGSTSLTTSITGSLVSRQLFYAYGEVRWNTGAMPTTIGYTGQRRDTGLGSLMFYNARYYSPYLNRWLQPDVIVPDGEKASIIPLTVSYHELPLLAQLNAENAFTLRHGHWPQLSAAEKREAKINRGPLNPQALNRYSYVLNNPLKYTDPDGHDTVCTTDMSVCSGGVVYNNSSYDILVRGDMVTSDGRLLQGRFFRIPAGKSSIELGIVDVDEIIVDTTSIDGHTSNEFVRVFDGTTLDLHNDNSGGITINRFTLSRPQVVIGGTKWNSYGAEQLPITSTDGHANISDAPFGWGLEFTLLMHLAKYLNIGVVEYMCPNSCTYVTQYGQ